MKLEKKNISENDSKELVNNLINIVERYVYLDIIKNPPQPKENYFNIVDLVEKLKNVNTEERPVYDLFRDINLIISECQDGHFSLKYNKEIFQNYKLIDMFFVSPIEYQVTKNGIYGKPSYWSTLFDEELINKIKEKENKKIVKINDSDPLEFIQKSNNGFVQFKSPQAQFVINIYLMDEMSLLSYQFEKGDLNNILILYEDESFLKYNYTMRLVSKTNEQFYNYFVEHFKHNPESHSRLSEISKSFLEENNPFMKAEEQIKWDKEIKNKSGQSIKCRIDNDKHMNVIYQETFLFDETDKILDVINKVLIGCFQNFYTNNYPIVIIENMNGGGNTQICDYLIALVNLNKPLTEYSSFRNINDVKKYIGSILKYRTLDTCDIKSGDYFFDKYEIDDYGVDEHVQKIEHNRTQIFSATATDRVIIENIKDSIKNKIRKPQEIIIFTDGYAFSSTSDFIKTTTLKNLIQVKILLVF